MKMQMVAFGVVLLVVGVVVAVLFGLTDITGRTHAIIPAGGIGLAVIGALVAALGATSKKSSPTAQFKCQACGASFGSQEAINSHSKDKHGK